MKPVVGWTGLLALLLAALVGAYGVYLAAIGPITVLVTPGGATTAVHQPNPAGVLPLVGAIAVWFGIQRRSDPWAWIGATVVLAFSVLFVFGPGGLLIPLALALVVVLIARRVLRPGTGSAVP